MRLLYILSLLASSSLIPIASVTANPSINDRQPTDDDSTSLYWPETSLRTENEDPPSDFFADYTDDIPSRSAASYRDAKDNLPSDFLADYGSSRSTSKRPGLSSQSEKEDAPSDFFDDYDDDTSSRSSASDDLFPSHPSRGSNEEGNAHGFSEFHPPKELVRAADVYSGRMPNENQYLGVAPAKWVGPYVQKDRVKENVAKEESSLKEDKDEEKDEVKTNASEKDDEETNNDDTPSSNKTLVAALPEFLKTKSIAIPGLNNCQANLLLKLAAYYETGDSNLYYGRCAPLDKHHGIAAGYVDLTVNQGSVGRVVKKYAESLPENTKNPFANYMELLADTAAGLTNPDDIVYFNGFCEVWQTVSDQPAFRAAYDSTLLDLYINPTVSAARSLHLTKPLSLTILFDSVLHLGLNVLDTKIIPNITATVAKDGEAVYISQLLILRTQYREMAAEAAKISIENGDEDDWDTAPDSEWKKGLAAYASLIVANGREKEGLMKSLEMSERTLAVAGDVNGTSSVRITCEEFTGTTARGVRGGMQRAAGVDPGVGGGIFNKPVGSWQGALNNGATSSLVGSVMSVILAGVVAVFTAI